MNQAEYDSLSSDYNKLTEQHYNMKASYELQISRLKEENRRLRDESQGRGLWAIAMTVLLVLSVLYFGFFG